MTAINNARPVRGLAFLVAAGLLTRAAAAAPRLAFPPPTRGHSPGA